jgi:phenylacetate-CoA ligase
LNLRKHIFWALDRFKGGSIKKELDLLRDAFDTKSLSHKTKLVALLNHAISTTEYYKNFKTNALLQDFPVLNKNIIRDNLQNFISNRFLPKDCLKVSTSGSTGAPFSIYQNKSKVDKNKADNIFFSSISNYQVGDYLVYIKIWPDKFNRKMQLNFMTKNIFPWSVFNLSGPEIDQLINNLNTAKDPVSFIGYPSAFEKICKHIDELCYNPIVFKTKSILAMSESLNTYTKEAVLKYFGVFPLSRYSNNENGIIAQQISGLHSQFRVNESSYIIEIFDLENDIKLDYGQKGRIVITDLYNFATPMIRYDTGDIGVLNRDDDDDDDHLFFSEISGRKLDLLYDTRGNLVPSHLSAKLCNYGDFKQFQLIQKDLKDYEIRLNTTVTVDESKMIEEFKSYFGWDANILIIYVDDIPLLASGKRREVVNEYYNQS